MYNWMRFWPLNRQFNLNMREDEEKMSSVSLHVTPQGPAGQEDAAELAGPRP